MCEVYKAENCETKEIVAIKAAWGRPKAFKRDL